VLNDFGDIVGIHGNPEGLYHRDTRFLSQLDVRLNDEHPLLLSSTPADNNSLLSVDLANTDVIGADGKPLNRELIYLNRRQFVWQTGHYELLLVRNFDLQAHNVTLAVRFAADFADIFEVRGQVRTQRGDHGDPLVLRDLVALRYRGLDDIERVTTLRFSPAPTTLDKDSARFALALAPGQWCRLALHVSCDLAISHPDGAAS
jgi:glycogen debranching enzyme